MIQSISSDFYNESNFETWAASFPGTSTWEYKFKETENTTLDFETWIGCNCANSAEKTIVLRLSYEHSSCLFVFSHRDLFDVINTLSSQEVRFCVFFD